MNNFQEERKRPCQSHSIAFFNIKEEMEFEIFSGNEIMIIKSSIMLLKGERKDWEKKGCEEITQIRIVTKEKMKN